MYHNDTQRTADTLEWNPATFADLTLQINRARVEHAVAQRTAARPAATPTRRDLLAIL